LIVATGSDPAAARVWLQPVAAWAAWWLLDDDGIYVAVDTDDPPPAQYPTARPTRHAGDRP
jgi:hypothetical protein